MVGNTPIVGGGRGKFSRKYPFKEIGAGGGGGGGGKLIDKMSNI
jgi:hypothetical protein